MMQYDHHVRVWWFVLNHEYQHMLWDWIRREEAEAEAWRKRMKDIRQMTGAEYNLAQDYIINDILLKSGIK